MTPDLNGFEGIDRVIADDLRFKLRLGIGEEAFLSLRLGRNIGTVLGAGGFAAAGAGVAASAPVAGTFFAGGGLLSALGLGAAAVTPVGWVAAAALACGGAYYGVSRLFGSYAGSRVQQVPAFINTPINSLGVALFDLMGTLAIKLAKIDECIDDSERQVIRDHFVFEWGYDPSYVDQAMTVLSQSPGSQGIRDLASQLAQFQRSNPDCNHAAMHATLIAFLREVAEADGVLDEREEMAIERIDSILSGAVKA